MHNNHYIGAAAEMRAASYYLGDGYEVFFPVMTQSASDFIIRRDGVYQAVQVKKATENPTESGVYLQVRLQGKPTTYGETEYTEGDFDILFVVHETGMWTFPWSVVSEKKSMSFGKLLPDGTLTTTGRGGYNPNDYRVH